MTFCCYHYCHRDAQFCICSAKTEDSSRNPQVTMTDISTWFLLHASPSDCTSSANYSGDYSLWLWMTLGVVGFKLCTNAVQFYNFCVAWNLISQTHRVDLQVLHFSKKNFISRKILIDNSLNTIMFRERRPTAFMSNEDKSSSCENKGKGSLGCRVAAKDIISTAEANAIGTEQDSTVQKIDDVCVIERDLGDEGKTKSCMASSNTWATRMEHVHAATSCPICLADFQPKEMVSCCKDLSSCKHVFHTECLQMWLFKHESCPVCRFQMVSCPSPPPLPVALMAVPQRGSPVAVLP